MDVSKEFDQLSGQYTEVITRWVPNYPELIGGLAVHLPKGFAPRRVLDLGCGNGNVTALLAQRFPQAEFTMLDASAEMIGACRERFADFTNFRYVQAFFQDAAFPAGSFDLITAGICIHHLWGEEKQALFARLYDWLAPGGIFTLSDLFIEKSDEPFHSEVVGDWERRARALGTPDEEWQHVMEHYEAYDHPSSFDNHLLWLQQAGFVNTRIAWQEKNAWGVIQAQKGSPA